MEAKLKITLELSSGGASATFGDTAVGEDTDMAKLEIDTWKKISEGMATLFPKDQG